MSGDPIARLSKIVRHDLEEIPVLGTPGILFSQELANLFRKFTTVPQHSSKSTWVTSGIWPECPLRCFSSKVVALAFNRTIRSERGLKVSRGDSGPYIFSFRQSLYSLYAGGTTR